MQAETKTALVTGSTHGVGRLVALGLAEAGFHVILHGRDESEGRQLAEEVKSGGGSASFHRADFAGLEHVRELAGTVAREHESLQLLINNAGIGVGAPGAGRAVSEDGHELRFAVNYLAPFLLTHLLVPTLSAGAPARIVNVASAGQAPLDPDDPMLEHDYSGQRAYGCSKLALVMFTLDIAEELRGRGVTANCLHPATYMDTGMVREAGVEPRSSRQEGAEAILHLSLGDDVRDVTGAYFDRMRKADPHPQSGDASVRERLRNLSLSLTGLEAGSREEARAREPHLSE